MSPNHKPEDDDARRRPSMEETYASKIHAAKLHIAANAAFEAIQRVQADQAAAEQAVHVADGEAFCNNENPDDDDDDDDEDDDNVITMEEILSAKFFRGGISDHSNAHLSDPGNAGSPRKRKSLTEDDGKDLTGTEVSPPELKRSRSNEIERERTGKSNIVKVERDRNPVGGKTAILGLIRAKSDSKQQLQIGGKSEVLGLIRSKSDSQQQLQSLRNEEDESIRLHEEIHTIAEENREIWDMCSARRKDSDRSKPTHHTHVHIVHETMVDEEEEDQDEAAKGLVCFEAKYHTVLVTSRDSDGIVAVSVDRTPKAIQIMMTGLARSVPNQFTDYIFVKEATSDGFILDYRISPLIYRVCKEPERVMLLRDFKTHLSSIRKSLKETQAWLQKADSWNKSLQEEVQSCTTPDLNIGLFNGRVEYNMARNDAKSLELKLKAKKPTEIEKVVTWQYEIS